MNASQLHLWILETLEPLKASTWENMNATIGSDDPEFQRAYNMAAGRHGGLHQAITAALDLVEKMQAEEREAAMHEYVIVCERCGLMTDDPDLWDPEADTGRVFCNHCWNHADEAASPIDLSNARCTNIARFGTPQLSR